MFHVLLQLMAPPRDARRLAREARKAAPETAGRYDSPDIRQAPCNTVCDFQGTYDHSSGFHKALLCVKLALQSGAV